MAALKTAAQKGSTDDITGPESERVREIIADLSASRAKGGYSPSETASFIFSLKQSVFTALRDEYGKDAEMLGDTIWEATVLLDKLGLLAMEMFQKTREEVISRQQQELLELSTPVVRLWENVLALPRIVAGAGLEQVFQNLISNAIKYRREGVRPELHVSAKSDGESWIFSVRDNGIGIEQQYQDDVFEPFHRLHGRDIPGSGIGLATCKKIVEANGGSMWLESKPGEGSTFYFRLPQVEAERPLSSQTTEA
jgi:signal transduction histidine kinase